MKCSNRSIVLSGNRSTRLGSTAVLVVLALMVGAGASDQTIRVEQAIADAVRVEMGEVTDVQVVVGQVRIDDGVTGDLEARPAPGARSSRRARFTLYRSSPGSTDGSERVGYAVAEAHVVMRHMRTGRSIKRGAVLSAEDLVEVEDDIGSVLLKPLPTFDEVVGSTVKTHLAEGALISRTKIRPPTLVRTGDLVITRARVGVVVVAARTTATESGQLGDVIRLVNEESGRRLKGRVVALGEVEVVY